MNSSDLQTALAATASADLSHATAEKPLKIFLAGHLGMVGSSLLRLLQPLPQLQLILRTKAELDLTRQAEVEQLFDREKPDWVIIAAAKVGGIVANQTLPADFIYQNLMIETNIIHSSAVHGVKRLMMLGSSCIYPKFASQPMTEDALLSGALEPTNEPYALAKIAGIKMCESYFRQYGCDFRAVMPTNLYGPWDNFHPQYSHVIPGLMQRLHQAKLANAAAVNIWGTGQAKREFLHVDDVARAVWLLLQLDSDVYQSITTAEQRHINIGSGVDIQISELAAQMAAVMGYQGQLQFDSSQPEGSPRKLLHVGKLNALGWQPQIELTAGLTDTYQWFLQHQHDLRQ